VSSDPHHRSHHRPTPKTEAFFDAVEGGPDPAVLADAAETAAKLLVRGARDADDAAVAERVVHLADTEGLDAIAALWSTAPSETLAGCLWRLYALRSWVHADPVEAAREYDAGRATAQVAGVVAGVADPPGPREVMDLADGVLRGIGDSDFADVLFRAAAFARVVATGRAHLDHPPAEAARMLTTAEQLEAAGLVEMRQGLT